MTSPRITSYNVCYTKLLRDPSPHPLTISSVAEELHTLLVNANVPGPYVMVGHSLSGLIVRVFTHNYPEDVAGMVLVDSTHERNNFV